MSLFGYRKTVYVPQINKELCNFCGRCEDGCLYEVIAVDAEGKKVRIKEEECWSCGLCVEIRPKDAITLIDRQTKKVMWANQRTACKETYWVHLRRSICEFVCGGK